MKKGNDAYQKEPHLSGAVVARGSENSKLRKKPFFWSQCLLTRLVRLFPMIRSLGLTIEGHKKLQSQL